MSDDGMNIASSKILYVDDLKENQLVLKSILTKEGYDIYCALSGEEALRMVLKEDYDLFILDIQMPGMDGFELAENLKAINKTKEIPIIFLTSANKEISMVKRGIKLGAVSYLNKPIDDELLKLTVNTFLQLYNKHRELTRTKQELRLSNKQLEETIEELETALEDLKITQSQLIHSEKMASLGSLIAGLAHEINNPMNFIYAGINNMERIMGDVHPILKQYNQLNENDDIHQQLDKINKAKKKHSFKEKIESIPELISDIKLGSERTSYIIRSLMTFTSSDKNVKKQYDIHEGINSSLMLLKNRITDDVVIKKKYNSKIGMIKCFPSQLNQVFWNILSNAIEALDGKGKITIETSMPFGKLVISIKDNGIGMTKKIKRRIFDPFFTTKEVGKGIGLGLSISYGIVEKHGGEILVITAPKRGSEFRIILPKR